MFLEVGAQRLVDGGLHQTLDLGVAELHLGLAFKLRVGQLDADDGREPFADIIPRDRLALEHVVGRGIIVDRAGQRRLEADEMGAALPRVDRIREREDVLGVAVVVLKRHLQLHPLLLFLDVDGLVQRRLVLVQMLDERDDAALVAEVLLLVRAFVLERDGQAAVQKGLFPQPLGDLIEAEFGRFKDLRVGLERDGRSLLARLAGRLQRGGRLAPLVALLPDRAALADFQLQPFREGVDDRHADAVQAAGDRIGLVVEFAAGVQHGQHHLGG